jgi:outer membrane protein OmpA-like peptidoglycan-associated protein
MFALGQDGLSEANRQALKDIARYVLADNEVNAIYVDGYTDNVGQRNENIELSRKRAEQVALYLIHLGVNPDIIALRYHGDYYPLAPNNSNDNRAKNRRVTVRLDKVPEATVREQWYQAITQRDSPKPADINP